MSKKIAFAVLAFRILAELSAPITLAADPPVVVPVARYRSRSGNGYRGYLSPTGPSSRYNQFKIPFYMRADRRVIGLLP